MHACTYMNIETHMLRAERPEPIHESDGYTAALLIRHGAIITCGKQLSTESVAVFAGVTRQTLAANFPNLERKSRHMYLCNSHEREREP